MPRQIQNYFDGLTAALQLKGQEPLNFLPDIRGGVELLPFLMAGRRATEQANAAVDSTTDISVIAVPADEVWLLRQVTYTLDAGQAGDVFQGALSFEVRGNTLGLHRLGASEIVTSVGPNDRAVATYEPRYPMLLQPRDELIGSPAVVSRAGAGDLTGTLSVLFARFNF